MIRQLQHAISLLKTQNNSTTPFKEYLEEERRQHSVVIANLPEPAHDRASARAQADRDAVNEVLDVLGMDSAVPSAVFRMGAPSDTRARLVKVEFPAKAMVRQVLKAKTKLKENPKMKKVQIRESLSVAQREHRKQLIEHCKSLRSRNLGHDFVIYANRVALRSDIPKLRSQLSKNP